MAYAGPRLQADLGRGVRGNGEIHQEEETPVKEVNSEDTPVIEYQVETKDRGGAWKPSVKTTSEQVARTTRAELAEMGHSEVRVVRVTTTHIREVIA